MNEGIAIVGMACRYPDAKTPGELWENVLARRRAFRRLPPERLRLEDYLTPDRSLPDGIYSTEAAVLEGYEFDRVRFRVVGSTYRAADLAHWLALDVATQALEDAGFPEAEGMPRETTGVLLGNSLTGEFSRANLMRLRWPYVRRVLGASLLQEGWEPGQVDDFLGRLETEYKAPFPPTGDESLAGGLSNTIAGRICNQFDLHGGGYTLDGACSSSLLAVANACSAIRAGDLDAALAGGVDLSIDPFELVGFARTGALASEEMRVYDARSAGFIPGEGCGFVVLMRESLARRLGCRVRAVIRGWGISSDGHGGISRPEAEGQKLAFARAYARAGFGMDTVGYFEGHGTGTAVGDAAELSALSAARWSANPEAPKAPVGSIKANIGHTKAAAGAAGLIKATLALEAQILPPNTGCEEPHPVLRQDDASLKIQHDAEAFPADRPLRAAVSAMGFGGINAHVVLEGEGAVRRRSLHVRERSLAASQQDAELFLLAAADAAALTREAERLRGVAPLLSRAELGDLAAELHAHLGAGPVRAALVAGRPAELAEALDRLLSWLREGRGQWLDPQGGTFLGGAGPAGGRRRLRIGYLFTGQGSPSYLKVGLLRRRFESLEPIYEMAALDPSADPVDTATAQPAILAHSLAGLTLLDQLGLRASLAAGHSLGEITALCWAGAFGAETALGLARARGRAMASLAGESGGMLSLAAGAEAAERLVAGTGAGVAALNGPARTVVSGPVAAIEEAHQRAIAQGIDATRLRVSHAFHSPLVAGAVDGLRQACATLLPGTSGRGRPLVRDVISTVTGGPLAPDEDLTCLLCRQVTEPVRFTAALEATRDAVDLWIEVGPGRTLAELAAESVTVPIIALDSGGRSIAGLLKTAGAAFAAGNPIQSEMLFAGRFTRPFDLDRPLRFLKNPCEAAPAYSSAAVAGVEEARTAPKRAQRAAALVNSLLKGPAQVGQTTIAATPAFDPPAENPETRSPLEVLRVLVAERTELPLAAVREESRLLSDLHLNSISVGQLVAEAARKLGARPPSSPTDYAQATVAEIASLLAQQVEAAQQRGPEREEEGLPAGVDSWVRTFSVDLAPRALRESEEAAATGHPWTVIAPPGHPLAAALSERLTGGGVALLLPASGDATDERCAPLFVATARAVLAAPSRFLLVQEEGVGGGFARTLHLEHPQVATRVVQLPFDHPLAIDWLAAEVAAGNGYAEASYDAEGERRVPRLRLLPPAAGPEQPLPLGPNDVLLVSGGGKGIAAECALGLARATGARLALLGRARPEGDRELEANLQRMRAAGCAVAYAAADVTSAAEVREALALLRAELGPITALLHSAGSNTPRLLSGLDEEGFARTFAPKSAGLRNLLAALDTDRLRLLVTFGSIIGRIGLKGEADYATANEWLARATERFAAEHPACRCLCLEWSVWAGVGMGERLGTLENLIRQGITPIPPDRGVELLREALAQPGGPVSRVICGRFGTTPTLEVEKTELPLLRYLEKPRAFFPGIELIVDAEVSADTDPHLADHVFRGEPLFAAVLGLEAMAQTAMALTGSASPPTFEDAVFQRPVAIAPGRKTTIRIAALVREPGRTVEVVLRDASTHFAADHFRALCRFGEPLDPTPRLSTSLLPVNGRLALDTEADLYGDVLFHKGRFRRVQGYRHLRATECLADISPDGSTAWFGRYLPDRLVLGDPGVHDAAIHGIQACIPHATLLPTGVERIENFGVESDAPMLLAARERSRNGNDFVYDLEVLGPDGRVRERWIGLALRAVDRIAPPASWVTPLLGPYVERRLQELFTGASIQVALAPAGKGRQPSGRRGHGQAVSPLLGSAEVRHAPDGRPETADGAGISVAHAGPLVFSVTAPGRIGCDLEAVASREPQIWRDLLGAERFGLAELIARERGESPDAAATRVWAAAESLKKAGAPQGAPLTLDATTDDGWLSFRSGGLRVGTFLGAVRDLQGPAAFAVAIESAS